MTRPTDHGAVPKPTPDEIVRLRALSACDDDDERANLTTAALDALEAAEREMEALRARASADAEWERLYNEANRRWRATSDEADELRDLQRAAIAYVSNTGACEMALDDSDGTCNGAGCDHCDFARTLQRVCDTLDRARAAGKEPGR